MKVLRWYQENEGQSLETMSLMHGRGSWDGRSHGIKQFRESNWNDGVAIFKQLNSMSLCFLITTPVTAR